MDAEHPQPKTHSFLSWLWWLVSCPFSVLLWVLMQVASTLLVAVFLVGGVWVTLIVVLTIFVCVLGVEGTTCSLQWG